VSNVHDITDHLIDSLALADIAKRAGITMEQAKAVAGMIADLPMRQAVRMCTMAQIHRIMKSQREAAKR
jgi:phosphoserine phosphatase